MQQVVDFLKELKLNNNRIWFEAHKAEYKAVQTIINQFAEQLALRIEAFDPSVKGLQVKDMTYRIYRDIRFSKDKTPYKTHIGIYIAPCGKCAGFSGYYFHIEPFDDNLKANHLVSSGLYMPPPEILKSIREDIVFNGQEFVDTLQQTTGFFLETENSLKKLPKGFSPDSPYTEYLKLKNFILTQQISETTILSKNLLETTVAEFKKTLIFNNYLNRAIRYAIEGL
jgi:uncharacterized protein (TIGR02453 family)